MEWTGCRDRCGYGRFYVDGREMPAHRWIFAHVNGPIPLGIVVMHKCDHPWCVNVEHLRLGTVADNNADMRAKGRDRAFGGEHSGEAHYFARLTLRQIKSIRRRAKSGETQRSLAARFSVSRGHISHVVRHTRWTKGA